MFLILILIVSSLFGYVYWRQNISKFGQMINKFPGPKEIPIFGILLKMNNFPEKLFDIVRIHAKADSETYKVWLGHFAMLNIVGAEDAEILLSQKKIVDKSFVYDLIGSYIGDGLLTSSGHKWQHRRKLINPTLHVDRLHKYAKIFGEFSERVLAQLKNECDDSEINVIPVMHDFTFKVICETVLGVTLDMECEMNKEINAVFCQLSDIFMVYVLKPWYYYKIFRYFVPLKWKADRIIKKIHAFTTTIIKTKEANFNINNVNESKEDDDIGVKKKGMSMLDLLLYEKNNCGSIDEKGVWEEVQFMLIAGYETTSTALIYALMLIANHKYHQEKIIQEQRKIFGNSKRLATYYELHKMQYLELCIKESLRLYPSVTIVQRQLQEDLQLSKFIAPAGSVINLHIYDIHRNPKYYSDPEKFDPDRFLPENMKNKNPYAFLPFLGGLRSCMGQKYAMLEMKSLLSSILRSFILEPVTRPEDLKFKFNVLLLPPSQIYVKFKPRL